ncbi:MAG: hypothetical protein MJA82_09160, partial [Clostridia bacterium]|nr:hypothetical protein [Clostridia bacterium]
MSNNKQDIYSGSKETILQYVEGSTGLKRSKKTETVMISEYEIEDDKIKFKPQLLHNIFESLKDFKLDISIGIYYLFLLIATIKHLDNLIKSVYWLDLNILQFNFLTFFFFIITPIAVWLLSTNSVFWNYTNYKIPSLFFIVITIVVRLESLWYITLYKFFIPGISRIEPTVEFTPNLIVGLGYIATLLPMALFVIPLISRIRGVFSKNNIEEIKEFKLRHHIKFQKTNPYEYVMSIITNMDTGKKHTVREHDRFIHTQATGATGTAKTSSCILTSILGDLSNKAKNVDAQKKAVFELIKSEKAYLKKNIKDEDFSINYVQANPGYEKELK